MFGTWPREYDRLPILISSPSLAPPQNPMFVAMGAEQREAFLAALQTSDEDAEYNFDSIIASISKVDASEAECTSRPLRR